MMVRDELCTRPAVLHGGAVMAFADTLGALGTLANLTGGGRTAADIHPTGDIPSMVLGHFIPMDAATTPDKDTLDRKVASRFRRPLTAAEYHRPAAIIARTRAAGHAWSIVAYNCNDFVADIARGIGMQTPNTLLLPYDFIPKLKAMNEHPSLSRHKPADETSRVAFLAAVNAPYHGH